MPYRLLIINPGSTSTKIGVYEDKNQMIEETIRHTSDEIGQYHTVFDQFAFRKDLIFKTLEEKKVELNTLDAVVGRGGLLRPIESGTYQVNSAMIQDLKAGIQGQHASNLGGILAHEIAKPLDIPALIVDPVVVDELEDVARISGMPGLQRRSIFHALNQKAVARRYAKAKNKEYNELNLIVAHLGGGVSVGAHRQGRIVEVNNALDGEGPFSPERSGGLPVGELIELSYSGKFTMQDMKKKILGQGGTVAYLGTNDFREVEKKAMQGESEAKLIFDSFIYQIGKEIGACAAVLRGQADAILLTGGIAYSKSVTQCIQKMVSFIAPIVVYPGEDELLALAEGGLRVLKGEEEAKEYKEYPWKGF